MAWKDITSFKAHGGHVVTEPAHVILTGTETNFISSARQHVVVGELHGEDARVRFTPVAWDWDYGDGATRTTSTPGATWAQIGVKEFSRTATSHVFAQNGDYTIRTAVTLRAEYSIAGADWVSIAGTLTLPTEVLDMHAYTASTVLVAEDCAQNSDGPGC